jgi:hypothetical protein
MTSFYRRSQPRCSLIVPRLYMKHREAAKNRRLLIATNAYLINFMNHGHYPSNARRIGLPEACQRFKIS